MRIVIIPLLVLFFVSTFIAIGFTGGMKYYRQKEKESTLPISSSANIIVERQNREIELYKNLCHSYEERIKELEREGKE